MSEKNDKKEKQKVVSKSENERKPVRKGYERVRVTLPKNLQSRVAAEKKPDEIIADALADYYAGRRRRTEIAVQKEIDNNIIEIQRRHISDLKEQLTVSNKNYEELMKTHQAYMLQVQPLIEGAKIQEAETPGRIEPPEKGTRADVPEKKKAEPVKTKKWYEFWK